MKRKVSPYGTRRNIHGCSSSILGAQVFRGPDGPAEKVERDVEIVFNGLSEIRVNRETFALHPDDSKTVAEGLGKHGHTVRTSTRGLFVDERFRLTLAEGPTVHLTDLRTCN